MATTRQLVASLLLLMIAVSSLRAEENLTIMTEDFPPFNYLEGNQLTGIGPDVVRSLMDRLDVEGRIRVMGWKHAYDRTLREPNMVLFSMVRTEAREDLFQWVGPIISARDYFYALRDFPEESLEYDQVKQARGILVQDGGAHHQLLTAQGFKNLLPYSNVNKQLKMLQSGRGDLLLLNDLTVAYQLRQNNLPPDLVRPVAFMNRSELYIAFSNGTGSEIVNAWQAELDRMHKDGTFASIEKTYLPR